jgi:hypothetical protein
MTAPRIVCTVVLWGLGLALPLLAQAQSAPPPAPGDTATTTAPTALWASADAVTLRAALPSGARLIVDAVEGPRLRVRSDSGAGWVSRSALDARPAVVRRSSPDADEAARPSWRLSLRGRRRSGVGLLRLAMRADRPGAPVVSAVLFNPSRRRTLKSARLGLVLYDRAPDSTAQHVRRRTVRAAGPLRPQSLAAYHFRVPEGARRACVRVRWVRGVRLDGTTVASAPRMTGRPAEGRARGPLPRTGHACLDGQSSGAPRDFP